MCMFEDPLDDGCRAIAIVDSDGVKIANLFGNGIGGKDGILRHFVNGDGVDVGEGRG